ncbi:hypothetical protein DKT77_05450 [Meridianimarinicoccus roseus]|uniref:Uncharacterized protein n=1 Tax=Meridianimarinicoccus roseus TaxID=2072018 RepID=A0A2V2LMS1_9RHOB|nr:hypothetical protein [Meridianimarinicoccus roseus]PWR03589.1 hypothetical protein DKT77_05450 [Meridianimarinicoccus roseus]
MTQIPDRPTPARIARPRLASRLSPKAAATLPRPVPPVTVAACGARGTGPSPVSLAQPPSGRSEPGPGSAVSGAAQALALLEEAMLRPAAPPSLEALLDWVEARR